MPVWVKWILLSLQLIVIIMLIIDRLRWSGHQKEAMEARIKLLEMMAAPETFEQLVKIKNIADNTIKELKSQVDHFESKEAEQQRIKETWRKIVENFSNDPNLHPRPFPRKEK